MKIKLIGTVCSALVISFCMLTSAFAATNNETVSADQAPNKTKYEHRYHHDKNHGERQNFEVCQKDKCEVKGIHEHNGVKYKSKYNSKNDKQEGQKQRYERCIKDSCEVNGIHEHDGKKYIGACPQPRGNYKIAE